MDTKKGCTLSQWRDTVNWPQPMRCHSCVLPVPILTRLCLFCTVPRAAPSGLAAADCAGSCNNMTVASHIQFAGLARPARNTAPRNRICHSKRRNEHNAANRHNEGQLVGDQHVRQVPVGRVGFIKVKGREERRNKAGTWNRGPEVLHPSQVHYF